MMKKVCISMTMAPAVVQALQVKPANEKKIKTKGTASFRLADYVLIPVWGQEIEWAKLGAWGANGAINGAQDGASRAYKTQAADDILAKMNGQ